MSTTEIDVRLYDCGEVAQILKVGTDWVRRKTQSGEVEHVRLGRNVRFTEAQVAALVTKYTKHSTSRPARGPRTQL